MKETKFRKGDYIVLLYHWSGDGFNRNYIYKQERDSVRLFPELFSDCKEDKYSFERTDLWTHINYANIDRDWRYATTQEAALYESLRKPYDVTTSNKYEIPVESYQIF